MKVHLNIAMVNLATASVLTSMLSSEVNILVHYADHQSLSWPIMWLRASVRVLARSNLVKSTRLWWIWSGVRIHQGATIFHMMLASCNLLRVATGLHIVGSSVYLFYLFSYFKAHLKCILRFCTGFSLYLILWCYFLKLEQKMSTQMKIYNLRVP